MADDLGRFLRRVPIQARPVGPAGKVVRWCGRKPALAGMAAALVLVFVIGLLAVLSQWRRAETTARRETEQRRRTEQHLHALELERVEERFHAGTAPAALALLAHLLRQNPEDRAVAERIANELTHRSWPLPLVPSMTHPDEVHGAEISPDGQRVVTTSLDLCARLWDASTGRMMGAVMAHDRSGMDRNAFLEGLKPIVAQFNHDGSRVVTGAVDHRARVWDGHTGEPITPWMQHEDWVLFVQFSPDGAWVATASKDGTACLWDAKTGERLGRPMRHEKWVNFAEFSPDGRRLLTGADDGTAQVWSIPACEPVGERIHHGTVVKAGAFSPNGDRLATVSKERTARVWDAATGQPVTPLMHHDNTVVTVAFSPDGCWLATGGFDKTVRLWDASTGMASGYRMTHAETIRSLHFSPDGLRLVSASEDGTARIWDFRTGRETEEAVRHPGAIWSARFSADGQRLVTASSDRTVQVWDVRPGAALPRYLRGENAARGVHWSPDGRRAVVGFYSPVVFDGVTGEAAYRMVHPQRATRVVVQSGWPSGAHAQRFRAREAVGPRAG